MNTYREKDNESNTSREKIVSGKCCMKIFEMSSSLSDECVATDIQML